MTTIEYDNEKITVPDSWDDITLGHYETFYNDWPQTARERVEYVAKVCNTSAEVLFSWPAEIFNRVVNGIDFLFADNPAAPCPFVEVDSVKYIVPIEDELSLGAWVDADEVQKQGVNVLSNILAIVCRPAGEAYDTRNNETRQGMFAALPVSKVLGVLAFFLACKAALEKRTETYTRLCQAAGQLPRSIKPSLSLGDGIKLLQIWRAMKYYVLMKLLYFRLQRLLHSFSTPGENVTPKRRKWRWINK